MISNLFTKLNQINSELEQTVTACSADRMNELDEQYTELWDTIYSYSPSNHDEAKMMVLYLLNELASRAENGEDIKNVRMKILEVFSQQVRYEEPLRAYGT